MNEGRESVSNVFLHFDNAWACGFLMKASGDHTHPNTCAAPAPAGLNFLVTVIHLSFRGKRAREKKRPRGGAASRRRRIYKRAGVRSISVEGALPCCAIEPPWWWWSCMWPCTSSGRAPPGSNSSCPARQIALRFKSAASLSPGGPKRRTVPRGTIISG